MAVETYPASGIDLSSGPSPEEGSEPTRRDFFIISAGAFAAVGAAATLWPFIDQMNPDASALALASIEVDISAMEPGQSITVVWRGKPVFIRYRTEEEIAAAKETPLSELKDPVARNDNLPADARATDENRAPAGREEFLVMVGICTHLGCVPLGEAGDYNGWFCPCHGSVYDTAGRIRHGPAPENMLIPVMDFAADGKLIVG
ncbi:ubiquinol-cytochrome c reductase iron-sulfur subunit [Afifella sp. IM 167]|uniref:ubiquinol-cytochrome c reductase iron-sulfur subunit n=1 Tax=Afifella sp. IM 167 TaxID=2033586 RepID=UPI001CCF956D|nr:ubiquinol-cytochrome c reductase iron-sulfur subunit [Afifella sp. IM 167]MBZ8131989.1 ubiquinol-cytochrome c reductase iron-sulfur subunit [Afifella sp. IM 167]